MDDTQKCKKKGVVLQYGMCSSSRIRQGLTAYMKTIKQNY